MSGRKHRWAPIGIVAVLLMGVLTTSGGVASPTTPENPSVHRPSGWLKGRVTEALTGVGLVATIVALGPQPWAGSTDTQGFYSAQLQEGEYSVTALSHGSSTTTTKVVISSVKAATANFSLKLGLAVSAKPVRASPSPRKPQHSPTQSPAPSPTPKTSPTPGPAPTPSDTRRPQVLAVKVGFSRPFIDASNASTYAERYDVIYGAIPDSHIDTLRAINPSIILLQYALPGGEKNESRYPDSSYVKDVASRLKVLNRHKYYLLNFGDPGVRAARRDSIIKPRVDGYWLDTAGPIWVNSPFFGWRDEAGKMADVGNLDGSWDPSMAESTKDSFTDGTWPGYMLAFHQELKAAQPGKLIIFNGMAGNPTRQATWGSIQQTYLSATYGAGHEFFFVERDGPVPERLWKWQLDRAQAILTSGKYMHVFTYRLWEHQKYAFASYLLIADGKYAWFNVYSDLYDPSLHEVDYGAPTGVYQTISTASGPIYKRLFTNATVWVNPGDVTRSGDGKSIRPKSAIIELR